jgi:hypothetical protein
MAGEAIRQGHSRKRSGITINRRDLIAVPVPDANLLWRDLHIRAVQEGTNGETKTRNIPIDILVSGVTDDKAWDCGFEFDYANEESLYCRPLRTSEDRTAERMPVPTAAAPVRVAFLPPMSGLAATEDRLYNGAVEVRIGEGRTAEVLRNLCHQIYTSERPGSWQALVDPPRGRPSAFSRQTSFRNSSRSIPLRPTAAPGRRRPWPRAFAPRVSPSRTS